MHGQCETTLVNTLSKRKWNEEYSDQIVLPYISNASYCQNTVKPLNFTRDLISLILQVKIREIKYLQKFKFCIDTNSKTSRFAKLNTSRSGSNFQFAKLSPCEIKVFYSTFDQLRWFKT